MLKRLIRLHPAYLVTIVLTIFLWYASTLHPSFQGSPPILNTVNLLLHLGYLNGIFNQPWLSPVFWTLGIEFQYYFLILLIYPFLQSKNSYHNYLCYAGLCCVPLVFTGSENLVFYWLNLFGLGIICFQYFSNKINLQLYCALTMLIAAFSLYSIGYLFMLVGLSTSIAITFLKVPKIWFVWFLSELSYSLYLVHVPIGGRVINIGERLSDSIVFKFFVLVAAFVFSLAFAYLMYTLIEKPTQKWSKSMGLPDL